MGGILEVGRLLGKGGMGVVYEVFHREWNRHLAMKVPLAIGVQDDVDLRRWVREAHTWIDLGLHPRVVSCWFVRQWKGVPVLFLDLFSGGSLKEKLEARATPPQNAQEWGEAITWLVHTLEGLQHAHSMGLIHRDIKPANLLFNSEGHLAVTDFGLGKAINKSESLRGSPLELLKQASEMSHLESSLTRTGVMSGTPHYAPPEQWMQKKVGPEADIYAFAIVAYEVLTGRHPFEPPSERWTLGQLISAHLMGQPPSAQSFHPEVPQQLAETLVRCLAKKSTDRPSTLSEIRDVLLNAYKERTGRDYAFGLPQPLSQRADSLNNKAVSLWSIGLRDEAMQAWSEADRLERNHLEVTYNRMVTSWLTGRRSAQEAESAIRELATASVRGRSFAGLFLLTRGRFPESATLLSEALESVALAEDGTVWRGLGEACMAVGEAEKAKDAFEKTLALIPTDKFARDSLALLSSQKIEPLEGLVSQTSWKARGKLSCWALMEDGRALIFLFGRQLVLADRLGHERLRLELPIATNRPYICTRGPYLLVSDGQQGWTMTLVQQEQWKLTELQSWTQRILGFVNSDVILAGDTTLQLRNRVDQSQNGPLLVGHEKQVLCYVLSADGQTLITGAADRLIRVWSLRDGQSQIESRGHADFLSALALGSKEQLLVSADRAGLVLLWMLPKMERLHRFEFAGPVSKLSLRGEGRDQILFVEYHPDENETRTAAVFLDRLQVMFDRPGRLFYWGPGFGIWDSEGFKLFGVPDGVEWRAQEVLGGPVMDGVFQEGLNEVYLWTEEGDCNYFRLPSAIPEAPSLPLVRANTLSEAQQARQQFHQLMEAAWASYRREDWSDAYWQLSRARLVEGYSREPETLEFLSRLAKRLVRRELREMWRVRELSAGHERAQQVTLDFRGAWAGTSTGNLIRIWDLRSGTCIRGLTGHRSEVLKLEFWEEGIGYGASPLLFSFGADRTVRLWNPNSGDCLQQLVVSEERVVAAGISQPVRRFAVVDETGKLVVGEWKAQEPFELEILAVCDCEGVPRSVALSGDGRYAVVSDDKSRVYHLDAETKSLKVVADFACGLGLSLSDGQAYLGARQDGNLELYRLGTKKSVGEFPDAPARMICLTATADGGVVATLDANDTLRFWLVDSKLCVLERRLGVGLRKVVFSGNGRYLAGVGEQGSVIIWELEWQLDPNTQRATLTMESVAMPEESGFWDRVKRKFGFSG